MATENILKRNKNLVLEINPNGTIEHISPFAAENSANYVAGPKELAPVAGLGDPKIEGYLSLLVDYSVDGQPSQTDMNWLPMTQPDPKKIAFAWQDDKLSVTKKYNLSPESLDVEITVDNRSQTEIRIENLALSVPINNDYTPWRFDQTYLYANRMCEHIYPGGANGYQHIERLNGCGPCMYLIPLGDTRFEHLIHYPGTTSPQRKGVRNHSWPGSSVIFLHSEGYLQSRGYKPLLEQIGASTATIAAGTSRTYRLRIGFVANRLDWRGECIANGKIHLLAAPSLTGPLDTPFTILAYSRHKLVIEPSEEIQLLSEDHICGGYSWKIKFKNPGTHELVVKDEHGLCAPMVFRITEPITSLLRARSNFILNRQVYRNEGDRLDGAIVPYCDGKFEGAEIHGLYVKEESLWGNGSYEGGITDAMFAADKNAADPNEQEIDQLEEYVDRYVRRYLQNPETNEVQWWCGEFFITRSYNYVHLANFYFSMYQIGRKWNLTKRHKALDYLNFAYQTILKMYQISRLMDVIVGQIGGQGLFRILDAMVREEWVEQHPDVVIKLRYHRDLMFQGDVPYGSECAYDNTGYECVAWFADRFNEERWLPEIARVMMTIRGEQPIWWWHGSDIRWWDAGTDFAECCHHYTSPLNSSALLMLLERGAFEVNAQTLSLIYGGLLGTTAKIHSDGNASMSYGWEQESYNFGFHVCTGDVGLSLFGTLSGLQALAYHSNDEGTIGYLCDCSEVSTERSLVIKPAAGAGRRVTWYLREDGSAVHGHARVETGEISRLELNSEQGFLNAGIQFEAGLPAHASKIIFHNLGRSRWASASGVATRLIEIAKDELAIEFDVAAGCEEMQVSVGFDPYELG